MSGPAENLGAAPAPAATNSTDEVQILREQLAKSESYVFLLQRGLEEMVGLPLSNIEKIKEEAMSTKSINPLLQNEAKMRLLQEENAKLSASLDQLRKQKMEHDAKGNAAIEAARLAEETVRATKMRSESKITELEAENKRLVQDYNLLNEQLRAAVDNEARMKPSLDGKAAEVVKLQQQLAEQKKAIAELEDRLDIANRRLRSKQESEDSERASNEAAKIQIHLMSKESEDKKAEIDRLRGKFVAALKQAAENHQVHMRIVEEKHKNTVNALREDIRTHEATILKLRAQLARVDVLGRGGNEHSQGGSCFIPSSAMQQHLLETQQNELRHLHAEVTSLQVQRDDALFRVEQLTAAHRAEADEALKIALRDRDLLKVRSGMLEERNRKLEDELAASREEVRDLKETCRGAQKQLETRTEEMDEMQRSLNEARRALRAIEDKSKQLEQQHADEMEEQERRNRATERRLDSVQKDELLARDRLKSQIAELEKSLEETRGLLRETEVRLQTANASLSERATAAEGMMARIANLQQSLAAHRQQLAAADEQLLRYRAQEEVMRADLRGLALEVERSQLETLKTMKEKERISAELVRVRRYGI